VARDCAGGDRSNVRRVLVAAVSDDEWKRLSPRAFELQRASPKGTVAQVAIINRSKKWAVYLLKTSSWSIAEHEVRGTFDTWGEASAMAKLFLSQED